MEIEREVKFLLDAGRRKLDGCSYYVTDFLPYAINMNRHLMVYYDFNDTLLKVGNTFRITMRKKDGVDKSRVTYKKVMDNNEYERIAYEYHFPITNVLNIHKREIDIVDAFDYEFLDKNEDLPLVLKRQCYLVVQRYKIKMFGEIFELDICRTNKGLCFEEIEIENPTVDSELIRWLDSKYYKQPLNKYQMTRKLNDQV